MIMRKNDKRYQGIKLAKSLGQHILADKQYLAKIIENCDFGDIEVILEVGPGPGNLTDLLLEQSKPVLAVELDKRFAEILSSAYSNNPNFKLFAGNILHKGHLNPEIMRELSRYKHWALISNLPYNVAGNVIVESLYCKPAVRFICATVQKEVALRLSSKPANKSYGPLSVIAQAVSSVRVIATIPPGAFVPPPKVQSSIVKIDYDEKLSENISDSKFFREFVHRLFRHRRKTLRAGWIKYLPEDIQQNAESICNELSIDMSLRAETLSVNQIIELAEKLKSLKA